MQLRCVAVRWKLVGKMLQMFRCAVESRHGKCMRCESSSIVQINFVEFNKRRTAKRFLVRCTRVWGCRFDINLMARGTLSNETRDCSSELETAIRISAIDGCSFAPRRHFSDFRCSVFGESLIPRIQCVCVHCVRRNSLARVPVTSEIEANPSLSKSCSRPAEISSTSDSPLYASAV